MAEGRMLSKRVSRSDKVAELKTDTARMFYTWLIPYLDVEGRMEANLDDLKADIAPRLKHITPRIIQGILKELHTAGLIILYNINSKQYLQLTQFNEHQKNLRKDRESPSKIPPPIDGVMPDELRQDDGVMPDELPPKIKIKIKLIEDKEKVKHKDCVFLFEKEFEKLKKDHGEQITERAVDILNNYKMSTGKNYKSDYHAILNWVLEKAKENKKTTTEKMPDGTPKEKIYAVCPNPKCRKEVLPADCFEKDCIHCAPRVPLEKIKALARGIGAHAEEDVKLTDFDPVVGAAT